MESDAGIICRKCYNGAGNQNGGYGASSPSQAVSSQSIGREEEEGAQQHKVSLAAAARAIERASAIPTRRQPNAAAPPPPPLMPIKRE